MNTKIYTLSQVSDEFKTILPVQKKKPNGVLPRASPVKSLQHDERCVCVCVCVCETERERENKREVEPNN